MNANRRRLYALAEHRINEALPEEFRGEPLSVVRGEIESHAGLDMMNAKTQEKFVNTACDLVIKAAAPAVQGAKRIKANEAAEAERATADAARAVEEAERIEEVEAAEAERVVRDAESKIDAEPVPTDWEGTAAEYRAFAKRGVRKLLLKPLTEPSPAIRAEGMQLINESVPLTPAQVYSLLARVDRPAHSQKRIATAMVAKQVTKAERAEYLQGLVDNPKHDKLTARELRAIADSEAPYMIYGMEPATFDNRISIARSKRGR